MPLQSRLFRDDKQLEAAAVEDSAHVARGARGEHVRKIQKGLNVVVGSKLAEDAVYGPNTAACILGYKTSRNIIGHAYQKQADDIVGKLTIALLDAEIALLEVLEDYNTSLRGTPISLKDLKSGSVANSRAFKVQLAITALDNTQRRISSS